MTEKELIKKIKQLKKIKPRKDWVFLTKKEILGREEKKFDFSLIFSPKLAFSLISLFLLFLLGGFLYYKIINLPLENSPENITKVEVIVPALQGIQEKVVKATQELKKIEEPQKILKAKKIVQKTVKVGEEIVSEAKKLKKEIQNSQTEKKEEVLTALTKEISQTKEKFEEMEKTYQEMLAEKVERLIEELEESSLSAQQKEIFEKAKRDFEKENYSQALEKILELSQ